MTERYCPVYQHRTCNRGCRGFECRARNDGLDPYVPGPVGAFVLAVLFGMTCSMLAVTLLGVVMRWTGHLYG